MPTTMTATKLPLGLVLKIFSRYTWPLGFNYWRKRWSRPVHLNLKRFEQPYEAYKLLKLLESYGAVRIKDETRYEILDEFDAFLVILYPKQTDDVFFARLKELNYEIYEKVEHENKTVFFVLVRIDSAIRKFKNITFFEHAVRDLFEEYGGVEIKRINNVLVTKPNVIIEHVKPGSGKYFMLAKDKMYITENVKVIPKKISLQVNIKLIKLLRKLSGCARSYVKRRFSRYQYELYKALRDHGLIEETKGKVTLIRVSEFLLRIIIAIILIAYRMYARARQEQPDANPYKHYDDLSPPS